MTMHTIVVERWCPFLEEPPTFSGNAPVLVLMMKSEIRYCANLSHRPTKWLIFQQSSSSSLYAEVPLVSEPEDVVSRHLVPASRHARTGRYLP
jgi:hypothetical protein